VVAAQLWPAMAGDLPTSRNTIWAVAIRSDPAALSVRQLPGRLPVHRLGGDQRLRTAAVAGRHGAAAGRR
jgi:hypothetical protein